MIHTSISMNNIEDALNTEGIHIIASSQNPSKPALAQLLALQHAISQERPILYFSMEQERFDILAMASCMITGICYTKVKAHTLNPIEKALFFKGLKDSKERITIIKNFQKRRVKDIQAQLAKTPEAIVVVDSLQYITPYNQLEAPSKEENVESIMRDLHELARNYKTSIIIFSHLSWPLKQGNLKAKAILKDLEGGPAIEQIASTVVMLRQNGHTTLTLSILKCHYAPTGEIQVNWDNHRSRIVPIYAYPRTSLQKEISKDVQNLCTRIAVDCFAITKRA